MKSTPSLLFTCFLISISSLLFAQSININTAKEIAKNHLLSVGKNNLKSASPNQSKFQFSSLSVTSGSKDTLYFVLNDTINHSFVIVAADKRSRPIIGYSLESSYNANNQPPAFVAWMENRKQEIESIKKNNLRPDSAITATWNNLSRANSVVESTSVEPLVQTQWDQGCYYNSLCPVDVAGPCGHVPTGCTITAMAQIMKYWNFPTKGIGSHSYFHPTYGNLSADFGSTTYQWSQMPNNFTSQNDPVATLMYHCGVSLDTEYGPGGSGAWDPRDELVQYFNYSSNSMLVNRSGFATSEWTNLLKSELDLRHPIWYSGSGFFGHSFICDGYQDADYFHFNWGWSGSSDGYFYIGNLNPAGNTLNENQFALINIIPGSLPDGYNGFFLSSNAVNITTKGGNTSVDVCSSANWTASSNQSWLSLSTNTGGSGKTTLTLTATENLTESDRSAIVTISATGFSDQSITVNQFTKMNVTPGGLRNLISKNATAITKLTLHGTIDARDFKTMRDEMPAITDVDLSDVTIVAYTGTEGTVDGIFSDGTRGVAYDANTIPPSAFTNSCNPNLIKSIILPSTIKSIELSAFGSSKYLTSIYIPSSVTNIDVNAFHSCLALINVDSNNPNYSSIDGVLFNKNRTTIIHCPISKTGNYTIPFSVTSIGESAFGSCIKLTTVTIPSSVTLIGKSAFYDCGGLTTIFIPSSVTSIESGAFYDCSILINVDANNPNYSSIDGVLFNKTQTKLILFPLSKTGSYTIPSSVTVISDYAFVECSGLTLVSIPSSVTSIGFGAFRDCFGLTTVTIPSSVTSITDYAFYGCYGLLTLTIPSSVTSIGERAFGGCSRLISVTIPSSVTSIGNYVFEDCKGLNSIYINSISPVDLNSSSSVFLNINKTTAILHVPYGSKSAYHTANQWNDFSNIVEMPGVFLSTATVGFGINGGTIKVDINSSINWTASSDQTWLTLSSMFGTVGSNTITFTASVKQTTAIRTATVTISATGFTSQTIEVFQYGNVEVTAGNLKTLLSGQLSARTSLTLTGTIDARDFKTMRDDMSALTEIDLNGVTIVAYTGDEGTCPSTWGNIFYPPNQIPRNAFNNMLTGQSKNGLTSIILPASVTSIGNSAFKNCKGLTAINIPPLVTSIEWEAFTSINGLINVDANNQIYSSIDGILFNKKQTVLIQCTMSKTGSYIVPSSVTFIEYYAFAECSKLISITIPSSVISIGGWAFSGCTGLSSIYAYSISPVDLNSSIDVFGGVNKNSCTLYVPYGSKAAYQAATQWKDFVNIVEVQIPNHAPVANAGNDCATIEGILVTLNGTGSADADGNSLTYKWTAPPGITLSSETVSKPTFVAPEVTSDTNYTFSLVVNDGLLNSTEDQVIITVKQVNKRPIADAGTDQSVNENSLCTLDGTVSTDPDNDKLTYLWTAPAGITLSSNTGSKPTFTTPEVTTDTNYTFSLVVNDGLLNSTEDQIVITVIQVNKPPTANAGNDQSVNENSLCTLDGSVSSDPDNDGLTYLWTAPAGITLSSKTAQKPTFTAKEVTTDTNYTFSLVVNDGLQNSIVDQVIVTVKNVDKAPYVKNPIENISVEKKSPDQSIYLRNVFFDDDLNDVLSYSVTSNTNNQVVTTKIAGAFLSLTFSTQYTGSSEIVITAYSNGKEVIAKFNVEVKIPTGIDPFESYQHLKMYPNPTNGKIKIVFDHIPQNGTELVVTDITGKTILKQIIQEKDGWIDLTGNLPGLYLLKTNLENTDVQKVILK